MVLCLYGIIQQLGTTTVAHYLELYGTVLNAVCAEPAGLQTTVTGECKMMKKIT